MASKKEKRNAIWLEAQKLLRESLKVPQLSNNLAEGVDNYPSGSLSVFLMSEDKKRGSGLPDGGDQLVKEPEFFPGSPGAVVDASELRIADFVVNSGIELSQPDFPVVDVNSGVEAEVGILADAGIDGATSEQSAIGEEENSEDEESQKFGDLSCPSVEPFYFALPPSESFSKRGREVSCHDVAFMRGKPRLMALWGIWFLALADICELLLTGTRRGCGMRHQSRSGNRWRIPHVPMFLYGSSSPLFSGRRRLQSVQ